MAEEAEIFNCFPSPYGGGTNQMAAIFLTPRRKGRKVILSVGLKLAGIIFVSFGWKRRAWVNEKGDDLNLRN
jgi:hypothetical protein